MRALRTKFLTADIGITGANFFIAETGMISITENEGNARLTAALPNMTISFTGIEKILPKLSDLALFLPMLGDGGTGYAVDVVTTRCRRPASASAKATARRNGTSCCSTIIARNCSTPSNATRCTAPAAARA